MKNDKPLITVLHNRTTLIMLLSILLLGATLRFYALGDESYRWDEIDSAIVSQSGIERILFDAEGRPPVYLLLSNVWAEIFGKSEVAGRSLSALGSVVALTVMFVVAVELFDERIGLLSVFLMAISEFQIFYAQDHRYYSFFVLFTLISFFFFIRYIKRQRSSDAIFYVISTIMMLYTQTPGVFVLAAQNLFLLVYWTKYRPLLMLWVMVESVIVFAFLPGLIYAIQATQSDEILNWIVEPSISRVVIDIAKFLFPLTIVHGRDYPNITVFAVGIAYFFVALGIFVIRSGISHWIGNIRQLPDQLRSLFGKHGEAITLGIIWFLVPILLPFILSQFLVPMFIQQYTISATPGFYLLLALCIVMLNKVIPCVVSLGALIIVIVPGLQEYYTFDLREQWRESAQFVQQNEQAGDVIVYARDTLSYGFEWYYKGNLSGCGIPLEITERLEIELVINACIENYYRMWLVVRRDDLELGYSEGIVTTALNDEIEGLVFLEAYLFRDMYLYLFETTNTGQSSE